MADGYDATKRIVENISLDFSANINPFPPEIDWDPRSITLENYPDDDYRELKDCIAAVFHRTPEEIAVGNGSIELIRVYARAVLGPGKTFRAEMPTFGEYAYSAKLACGEPAGSGRQADATFVCNPNNPTGQLLDRGEVLEMLGTISGKGDRLFVDEAFIELTDPPMSIADRTDPCLFVLRSITKSFSVPGIRFGYGFGDPELIAEMESIRPPWSINAFAERFAIQAFRRSNLLSESRTRISHERRWLHEALTGIGLSPLPAAANFILVPVPKPASVVTGNLEKFRILARDCTSFGLPEAIRVAVRKREENVRLVEALDACLH